MDSETLPFPSKEGIICLMLLLFSWTFAFIYVDSLLHRYQLQVPTVLNALTTHTSSTFKISFL